MASPQCENGYLKIANEIAEALARTRLCGEIHQVLWTILRKSWGWGKKEDIISLSQFVISTGLKKPNIIRALRKLESQKIIFIIKIDNGKGSIYRFNKDFSTWEPLSKMITLSKRITNVIQIDNKSLSKLIPTKETIKDTIQKGGEKLPPSPEIPFEKIVDIYHETLPMLPRCLKLTDARKRPLKGRWMGSKEAQSLDWWKRFLRASGPCPFT